MKFNASGGIRLNFISDFILQKYNFISSHFERKVVGESRPVCIADIFVFRSNDQQTRRVATELNEVYYD